MTNRIVGLRIALQPVVEDDQGQRSLMREIAAQVFDVPRDWTHVRRVRTDVEGLEDPGAVRVLKPGPQFDMILDPEFHAT